MSEFVELDQVASPGPATREETEKTALEALTKAIQEGREFLLITSAEEHLIENRSMGLFNYMAAIDLMLQSAPLDDFVKEGMSIELRRAWQLYGGPCDCPNCKPQEPVSKN